ncbi:class I SAM-dependent methyltransferase [Paraliomyxa miuraensis]|uniref:class I SAM-dependent methyltransferase n=1 Tax=Paraliomyxa miuraensis TaxID=376150 RepID=UPI00225BC913|nr:class I SAM-dependent methyltransferase [Paraliomyxa miuraensis]MCX4243732.1 class I SAM-dependent methyltransferase [Paraliomyxa miuraensis]
MSRSTGDGVDAGNVVGNVYDKYGTRNPIARRLMRGFLDAVTELYGVAAPRSVLEVGCGEGELAAHLWRQGPRPERFELCDVDLERLRPDLPPELAARPASIYELPWPDHAFDLVVCCEVLEHLHDPARGLRELARVARRHVLLSTPWEPVWRVLNVARGRYLSAWGNTPGHVQHFDRSSLTALARTELRLVDQRTPLPWTILLGTPRRADAFEGDASEGGPDHG